MGVSLARLRRDVGGQIGEVLVCTATATGTTSTFIDTVRLVQGDNTLAGRQAVMTTAATAANQGVVRLVTGNAQAAGVITVRPDFAAAPVAGDVIELYAKHGAGPTIEDLNRAINRAIRDAAANALVEDVSTTSTYDPDSSTLTLDSDWTHFIGAEVQDEETETWAPLPWWGLDPVARTVNLGYRVHGNGQYDGHLVRLRGYTTPGELTADSDETAINPEWLVARASYHALITTASRRSPADANQALGLAQVYREEADRLRGLTRTRMRPCHALGG